ncbi:hypothetical protein DE146DRAFT_217858 [Phaeosphaeria sp. MPI-PUGE-AT-0046c]|nr:hypothetical protein DE146DRAFT_217858 [Phaeosphaeria sp. MPI-PUGE-AT-0046c]
MDNSMQQHPEGDPSDPFSFSFGNDFHATASSFQDGGFTELQAALGAAQTPSSQFDTSWMERSVLGGGSNESTALSSPVTPGTPAPRPKIGSRFSREVIRTLKNWLAAHQNHPYPREDDMTLLQQRTGLNHAQLANWFANARRRGKVEGARPASPQVRRSLTSPVDIIPRPGTPAIVQDSRSKDPLQRWVDSPPEHEPADVGDIARAMASDSREHSYVNAIKGIDYTYNDQWLSPYISSASSAGTSQSSEKSTHRSSGSQSSLKIRRPTRRKRTRRRPLETAPVAHPNLPYQCTFCTECFKTKYDWQRHEKSLHLPLEKWVCALHGARAAQPGSEELSCVFCGLAAPTDAHIEGHHYTLCQERELDERTFHRKDHLVQHLRLVHDAKYESWSMKAWMIPMPDVKSRCGFCSLEMNTWTERTDHLGEHFKAGSTMADWKGDWGFTEDTERLVEHSVPPYFNEYEKSTLIPMRASDPPWGSPPNGYELLKVEIEFFIQNYMDSVGRLPTNDDVQLEACRIIYSADATLYTESQTNPKEHGDSWLRDLIMSSTDIARQARFGPLRTARDSRHSSLTIHGKDYLFEQCPLESQLRTFVLEQRMQGIDPTDAQIQTHMSEIVRHMEVISITPSDTFANWVVKGIYSGAAWLQGFKQRAGLSQTVDLTCLANGIRPPQVMDDWTQLTQHSYGPTSSNQESLFLNQAVSLFDSNDILQPNETISNSTPLPVTSDVSSSTRITMFDNRERPMILLPDDTNFFRIFETDLRRWVCASMSPKNPNCHIPSDEEMQHQARWIMYNCDDPWNQTPADFSEWLWRFKRGLGIANEADGINPAELTRS